MLEGSISAKLANPFFEKDIFKVIKRRAALGSLLMMIPDFGLGGFIYIAILWSMYTKISEKVGISFSQHRSKLIGVGFVVNVIVAFVIDFALSTLFFIEPFIVYLQFYLSGKLFVESLKKLK